MVHVSDTSVNGTLVVDHAQTTGRVSAN